MKVIIKTHNGNNMNFVDVDKIEFAWRDNEILAYFNGRSFPIELLRVIEND